MMRDGSFMVVPGIRDDVNVFWAPKWVVDAIYRYFEDEQLVDELTIRQLREELDRRRQEEDPRVGGPR